MSLIEAHIVKVTGKLLRILSSSVVLLNGHFQEHGGSSSLRRGLLLVMGAFITNVGLGFISTDLNRAYSL